MIPKIAKQGTSFKGAGLYYLHDKEAMTNERVAFTQTQNLPTADPELAMKVMAFTAMCHKELKEESGKAATGNKIKTSVYSFSLSWEPSKTTTKFNISSTQGKPYTAPTQEEMIKAGLETLKALGLHEHESVIIGHNDTAHPHVHVIVNRINPETGIVNTHSFAKRKLSRWAEKHERERGHIFCKQRVENNARIRVLKKNPGERLKGEYVKYKEDMNKAEYYRLKREKTKQALAKKQKELKNLEGIQKADHKELLGEKEKFLKARLANLKEDNRPRWASIYKRQKEETSKLEEIQRSAISRAAYYIKNRQNEKKQGVSSDDKGVLSGAFGVMFDRTKLFENQINSHKLERKALATELEQQNRSALSQSNEAYFRKIEDLKAKYFEQQREMKELHNQDSLKRAGDVASGRSYASYNMKQSFKDSKQPQNDNAPPKAKESFTHSSAGKKKDPEFDFVNDNYFSDAKDQNKDAGLKDEFNFINDDYFGKSKDKEKGKDKGKNSGHSTNTGKSKDSGMGRSM